MEDNTAKAYPHERRSEPRHKVDRRVMCRISLDHFRNSYEATLRDRTGKSLSLLLDKDSDLLSRLTSHPRLSLMYCPKESHFPVTFVGASVKHVTREGLPWDKGRCIVGLEFLRKGEKL